MSIWLQIGDIERIEQSIDIQLAQYAGTGMLAA